MVDKFVTPVPLPTEHEREILTILIEECAEVQQRATKLLRFGADETQPGDPCNNSARLSLEIGDLMTMVDLAVDRGLVDNDIIQMGRLQKLEKLAVYMQTSPPQRDTAAGLGGEQ